MKNKKNIKLILLFILICGICVSASAKVTLYENNFYDGLNGTGYIFGKTTEECDELGITVKEQFFPATVKTLNGIYGIGISDLTGTLGASYDVRAYIRNNNEYTYSDDILTIQTGIITANPENISEKVQLLKEGDVLLLEDGTYNSCVLNITASGSISKPIVIRAEHKGKAIFSGESSITVSGNNVTVADLFFKECLFDDSQEGPVVSFSGCEGSRLTNCEFITSGNNTALTTSIVSISGKSRNVRIDNNLFQDPRGMSVVVSCNEKSTIDTVPLNTLIDHNYFLDVKSIKSISSSASNGLECIQTGQSRAEGINLNTIVEYNRFENVTGDASEIISNKSDGNIYRYNTFVDCKSSPCLRGGNNVSFIGNYLINVSKGIRFFGDNISINDNYIYSSGPIYLDCGTDNVNDTGYLPQTNCTISGNTIIAPTLSAFVTGRYFDTLTLKTLLPSNVMINNNVIYPNGADCIIDYANCEGVTYKDNKLSYNSDTPEGFEYVEYPLISKHNLVVMDGVEMSLEGLIHFDVFKDNWWKNNITLDNDMSFTAYPDETPVTYSLTNTTLYLTENESIDLGILSGTAKYSNGRTYDVPKDAVEFTTTSDAVTISNGKLTVNDIDEDKTVYVTSSYKGLTKRATLNLYTANSYNSETGDYYDYSGTIPAVAVKGSVNYWNRSNGTIETTTTGQKYESSITIHNLFIPENDFELSMDITVKQYGTNTPKVWMDFGKCGYKNNNPYTLILGENGGIYATHESDSRVGELWGSFEIDKKQTLKLSKHKDTIVVSIDGKIVSVAKVDEDIKGKIGFGTYKTYFKIENINLYEKNFTSSEPLNIEMDYSRIDENVINIKFDSIGDDYVYKLYKNDVYYGDCKSGQSFTDINVKKYKDYIYTIEAYDISGLKKGIGSININLPDSTNEFFNITDVQSRSGADGTYISYYISSNRFLDNGTIAYCDRNSKYISVADEFKDCGYIQTANGDRSNEVFKTACDDWLTFNINRSATVYVLTHSVANKNKPNWLNDWTLEEDMSSYFSVDNSINTSYVYSKHFSTTDGVKKQIKLGGFSSRSSMYLVVVKPDVMPDEKVEIIRK